MQARHPVTVHRTTTLQSVSGDPSLPSIDQLLSIDTEYREKAANDELVRIAPRQFNPTGAEWLPILHARRNEWHYTAAFSNTAHAHKSGMTDDWVIIHRDTAGHSGHWTVITSKFGELKNQRSVRGREEECRVFYRKHPQNVRAVKDFKQLSRLQQKLLFDMD
jgi:putative hydrolase